MNVIVEAKIPFIRGLVEQTGHRAIYASPEEIDADLLAMTRAEAMIVRTRTRCDAALLDGSAVRFIATATIGTDHIDSGYCRDRGITVANAPGCNAPAVAQYVLSSIAALKGDPRGLTLGVVGVGNVGRIVARWAEGVGMRVLRCDPPRAEAEGHEGFVDLDVIAREADVITFHTPLTREGDHPTFHLCDAALLAACRRKPLIINAARGPVADSAALVDAYGRGLIEAPVIDCWEGEPVIPHDLLDIAAIATPHIAGYSLEGKQRATRMAMEAFCRWAGAPLPADAPAPTDAPDMVTMADITASYDPLADSAGLKADPSAFESLRNWYEYRGEPAGRNKQNG